MKTLIRAVAICAALGGSVALTATPARAQEAPRIVESAAAEGGFTVVGSVTAGGRTYTAAELDTLLRAYLADPMNLSEDLPPEVRGAIYKLAGEIY